jgi:5-methylthioadenosine/S-adenosylhomocysteine deaminase
MAFFHAETSREQRILETAAMLAAVRRYVLRGRVVTMNSAHDVIADGFVCVEDDKIAQIGPWSGVLPSPFDQAPLIDTSGSIYPGLIELHNHPAYNVIPMWTVPERFANRNLWRANADYLRHVSNPDKLLTGHPIVDYPKALVRFVECRALLGGVTTTQGLQYRSSDNLTSYFQGLLRIVEFPGQGWPVADDYIFDFKNEQEAEHHIAPALAAGTPYIIHLSEGIDQPSRAVFDYLRKADDTWLIGPPLLTIHATALDSPQFQVLAQQHCGGVVWSPLSNLLLYGDTTKVELAKQAGLPIAIGCDWAPSGTKNLLGELKIAKLVSTYKGGVFSDRDLADAVTRVPAGMMGWGSHVGSIENNKTADLLVLDGNAGDPYLQMIQADESKVVAVIIDGHPRMGRTNVIDPRTPRVEAIHIAGQDIVLDIIDSTSHPLGGTTLTGAIATITQALANLPDVARQAHRLAPAMRDAVNYWRPIPGYELTPAVNLFAAGALPGPGDVDPMTAEPLTAYDDSGFIPRIKANINVPPWLKNQL